MRQQLSRETPLPIRIINAVVFTFFLVISVSSFLVGQLPIIPLAILVATIGVFFFEHNLATVSIDENHVYLQKGATKISVHPDNIQDVDHWHWSKYLILRFKMPTDFGTYVIFEPSGGSGALDETLRGAEAFESIGRLCGWRK